MEPRRPDQIIADAPRDRRKRFVAIPAREVVRLREAPAVVLPELTSEDLNRLQRHGLRSGATL